MAEIRCIRPGAQPPGGDQPPESQFDLCPVPVPADARVVQYAVSGEAQINRDGSPRQLIIRKCRVGDELLLVREPQNTYDEFAVALYTLQGQQVGYIPSVISRDVASRLDAGAQVPAFIAKILGGTRSKPNLGLIIDVHWPRPERPKRRRSVARTP